MRKALLRVDYGEGQGAPATKLKNRRGAWGLVTVYQAPHPKASQGGGPSMKEIVKTSRLAGQLEKLFRLPNILLQYSYFA